MDWKDVKKQLLQDPELVAELENNETEYQLITEIIRARIDQKLTQQDLAERIGTRQSNISRLESGNYNPSLEFIEKCISLTGLEYQIIRTHKDNSDNKGAVIPRNPENEDHPERLCKLFSMLL